MNKKKSKLTKSLHKEQDLRTVHIDGTELALTCTEINEIYCLSRKCDYTIQVNILKSGVGPLSGLCFSIQVPRRCSV